MTLSDLSIRRPVFTTMMSVLLVVLGLIGISRLGTDLFPDASIPVVLVQTVYRGAGPQEIETQVVKPIEDVIAGINGVDFIHSFARDNVGFSVVQFTLGADIDRAVQEVRDKVSSVQNRLPSEAELPRVARFDISAQPIVTFAASSDLPTVELRKLIVDKVQPALAQIDGVAEARITGGDEREVRVDIDLDRAKAAGVAPGQIAQLIGLENVDVPAGRLDLGPTEVAVRSLGQFTSVDDVKALPVTEGRMGAQVRLDEVASVVDGLKDRVTVARLDGSDAVILEIIKQPGNNTVKVSDAVKARMQALGPTLGHGFKAAVLIDQADLIRENAREVWVALIFGGFMAVLIILAFLLDVRGTIISALALPTSVIGTFFVMYVLGYSMNQMTLLALSLAIGLLIDDAVVVRESITHRLEQGESPKAAASKGTRDVYLAVLATTLSLVAVFVPVAFMPGIAGQFFKQFGITISAAVLISLFVSFTLDPMLSSRFVKKRGPHGERRQNAVAGALRRAFEANERGYERLLRWVLKHKAATTVITLALLLLSAFLARGLKPEFLPQEDRSQFTVDLQLGDGASLNATIARAETAEQLLHEVPEVTSVVSVVGANGDSNKARIRVLLTPKHERTRGVGAIKDALRPVLVDALPSTRVALIDPPPIEGGGDFLPVMVRLIGPDLGVLKTEGERIAGLLRNIKGTADVRLELNPPKPELQVAINRERAHDLGLTSASLGGQLRMAVNGQTVGKLREGQDETDITVRLSAKDRASPEALQRIDVFTPKGVFPVTDVASVDMGDGPSLIERHNRQRQVMVASGVGQGGALGAIVNELEVELKKAPLPDGYSVVYDGQVKLMKEQISAFAFVFLLAFVFVYMVLASQFESFKHPFTIIVSVPLALIGALLGLVLFGFNLSMGAMIGVILLMGLVTKNAILLVDAALQNLRAGDDLDTALLKAGPRRLRPILMTSAAMAIGMLPTAIGSGVGSEFRAPMAIAVIGGVISSTFLTLVVVPVVFSFFEVLTPKSLRSYMDKEAAAVASAGSNGTGAEGVGGSNGAQDEEAPPPEGERPTRPVASGGAR